MKSRFSKIVEMPSSQRRKYILRKRLKSEEVDGVTAPRIG